MTTPKEEKTSQLEETTQIGNYRVPANLVNEYVKFSIFADSYLLNKASVPSGSDYERTMRWTMCVQKIMQIHREICKVLGIPYSEDTDDPFYIAFHSYIEKQKRLKG